MRIMRLLLVVAAAAVPLFGQTTTCTSFSLPSGGYLAPATATDTSKATNIPAFTVTTQATCPFVAATAATWLHVLPPSAGTNFVGTSQVSFTVDQNTTAQLRTDQISIYPGTQITPGAQAVVSFTVAQVAGICTYTISPSSGNVPVAGGSGSLTVTSGCAWGAAASSFITLTAPNGTVGTEPLNYKVAANPCAAPRSGQILLQGTASTPVFQLTEDGSLSNFVMSSTTLTAPSTALTNQRVTWTTDSSCSWNSYTDASSWLHATGPTLGNGSGIYSFSVDANLGTQRTGHIFFQSGTDLQGNPLQVGSMTVTQQAFQAPGPVLSSILNAASYTVTSPAPVSPGEIVALFGANLGPVSPVVNTQTFGTTLGGVRVMFGSNAAPLIFVSAGQINAVVPYEVDGSTSVAVTVQYAGGSSTALTVPVQAATPGIFSNDHSGSGPGAILNQDYSLNSSARPAAAGSAVAIYCTGAGSTTPTAADGALAGLTPPFPTLNTQPVTVTIGGVSAQVLYAGPTPGSINGLTQINAVVPGGLRSGSAPVVVSIGGVSSQSNLSMSIQ